MLHCFLLSKALVIKIDEKTTFEGLEPGVRGSLAKILCQESNRDDGSSIRVLVFRFMTSCKSHPKPFLGLLANSRSGHKRPTEKHFWVLWDDTSLSRHGLGEQIIHMLPRHGFINWTLNPNAAFLQTEKNNSSRNQWLKQLLRHGTHEWGVI